MITEEEKLAIRQMYFRDKLRIHAISKASGRHHLTIKSILFGGDNSAARASQAVHREDPLDAYKDFIAGKFSEYPDLKCSRLVQILETKGLKVSVSKLRRYTQSMRIKQESKAFMKVRLLQGEQAQVDWASFGILQQGKAKRKLSLFVMVLSYSRAMYARFYFNQSSASLLSAHHHAFEYFGGVPSTILYDNMRTAVTQRLGSTIKFNDDLLKFAARHCFKPDACNPYSGWEKGRVERLIRFVRSNFFCDRYFRDLSSANDQMFSWLNEHANRRTWSVDRSKTVWQVWQEVDKPALLPFKNCGEVIYEQKIFEIKKHPYVRFDLNDYSVPHEYVGRSVIVFASDDRVRIFADKLEIASHVRCYSKGEDIEDKDHIEAMIKSKTSASYSARKEYLFSLMDSAELFFQKLTELGHYQQSSFRKLYELLRQHAPPKINDAMAELLDTNCVSMGALSHALELGHGFDVQKEVLPDLSIKPELKFITVKSHDLSSYHHLMKGEKDE